MQTPLPPDEVRRRIVAVRTLRGLEQTELAELMHQDGLGKHDLGRIERGEIALQATHRRSIAHHLRVDERWLSDADIVDVMLLAPAEPWQPQLDALLTELREQDERAEARAADVAGRIRQVEANQRDLLQSQADLLELGIVVRELLLGMQETAEDLAVARAQAEIERATQESAQPQTAKGGSASTRHNSGAGT